MYDCVVACEGLKTKIRKVEVMVESDSRQHKSVRCEVWRKMEPQEGRILLVSKPLPGRGRGKVPTIENSSVLLLDHVHVQSTVILRVNVP